MTHTLTSSDTSYTGTIAYSSGISSAGSASLAIYQENHRVTVPSNLVINQGSAIKLKISINRIPTSNVVINIINSNSDLSLSSTSVTFTTSNWSDKTVNLYSTSSSTAVGKRIYTISYSLSSSDNGYINSMKAPPSFSTTIEVIISNIPSLIIKNSYLNLSFGSSGTFTVNLSTAPSSSVTATVSFISSTISISPGSLTFTTANYNTAQAFTVLASSSSSILNGPYFNIDVAITLSSTDSNYNGYVYYTSVNVINICKPAAYSWTNFSSCSGTINFFNVGTGNPVPCDPGYYYNMGACTVSSINNYSYGRLQNSCPTGFYTVNTGNQICTRALQGFFISAGSSSLSTVPVGSYAIAGKLAATSCSAGDFCPRTNINAIYKCISGSYSAANSAQCTSCPEGFYCSYTSTYTCGSTKYSPVKRSDCISCSYSASCSSNLIKRVTEGYTKSGTSVVSCSSFCSIRLNYKPFTCPQMTYYSANKCLRCSENQSCLNGVAQSCSGTTPLYNWGMMCISCNIFPLYRQSSSACATVNAGYKYVSYNSITSCGS